jgi:predicted metallo-beta-lactamase superfamily hydrolase
MLETADGKTFTYGKTLLHFSEAVAHGSEDLKLGWVIMVVVEYEEERFMFAPDIQGPMSTRTLELILAAKPTVIMLGGPPFYLLGSRTNMSQLKQGLRNLKQIVEEIPLVILDHHSLRDESWIPKIEDIFQKASETGHCIVTSAEYSGKENTFLESKRKQLFFEYPPSEEFNLWMKTLNRSKIVKPPI